MKDNKILDVSADVKWIGVLDPDLRTFDIVMETKYGTTYNSYFINAEKKTIVETTKYRFWDTYLEKIKQLTDPNDIQYIVVNHTEPDHSGNVENLLKVSPHAIVVGSGNTIRYLNDLIGHDFPHHVVKDGDTLDLGNKTLRFINAPNLHWPDSTYTFLEGENILFTCDSFGAHYCDEKMYDDVVPNYDDAFKYYFDVILRPFSKFMLKAIEKIKPLDVRCIAPGHGPVLRKDWKKYVDLSEQYAKEELSVQEKNRVLVAYVSAYGNTALMASKIAEGLQGAGALVDLCDIEKLNLTELSQKIAMCSGVIIGSPTINQNILSQIYLLFALINPIRDKGKLAGSFGSYGWSGEANKIIQANCLTLKLQYVGEGIFTKFTPHDDIYKKCVEYGKGFVEKLKESKIGE